MWVLQFTGYLFTLRVFYNKKMDWGDDRRILQVRENAFLRASCHLSYPDIEIIFPYSLLTTKKYTITCMQDLNASPYIWASLQ